MSGSTAYASSSTTSLSSMTSSATLVAPANWGPVVATNNIINQRADASRSLYQICVNLKQRLAQVPGFAAHLDEADNDEQGEDIDPVSSLWQCLRKGTPLMTIYNALQPAEALQMDEAMAAKNPKKPAFKFVEACLRDLKMPPGNVLRCRICLARIPQDLSRCVVYFTFIRVAQEAAVVQPKCFSVSRGAPAKRNFSHTIY